MAYRTDRHVWNFPGCLTVDIPHKGSVAKVKVTYGIPAQRADVSRRQAAELIFKLRHAARVQDAKP